VFVTENRLKINLPALVENAISKWGKAHPAKFRSSSTDECGDHIAAEMNFRGLRCLHGNEPWFSDEATADEFRECVFAALDRWVVESKPAEQATTDVRRAAPPFSESGRPEMPLVEPYLAFNESAFGESAANGRGSKPIGVSGPHTKRTLSFGLRALLALIVIVFIIWLIIR
jgi:hypothetical protein